MAAGIRSLFCLTVFSVWFALAAQDSNVSAVMSDFALPEYKDNNQLKFILYGKRAVNAGVFVDLTFPVLDVMRENKGDITQIVPLQGMELYPLNTPFLEILAFWEEHILTRYMIASYKAMYDKNQKTIRSDSPVRFRSPEMDVDGVGFDADLQRQQLHVRSNVKIHLRLNTSEKAEKNDPGKGKK